MSKISAVAQELDELENMMRRHDRWYDHSDDHRVFQKGRAEFQAITAVMTRLTAAGWGKEVAALKAQYFPQVTTPGV